jgi:hypothetical protein
VKGTEKSSVYLSENFASSNFTSPRARRLRALYTVLQWNNKRQSNDPTYLRNNLNLTVAMSLLEAATIRRASGEMKEYPNHLRLSIVPNNNILVGADIPNEIIEKAEIIVKRDDDRKLRMKHQEINHPSKPNLLSIHSVASRLYGHSSPGIQLLRYFDCQTNYSEEAGSSLLSLLASVSLVENKYPTRLFSFSSFFQLHFSLHF